MLGAVEIPCDESRTRRRSQFSAEPFAAPGLAVDEAKRRAGGLDLGGARAQEKMKLRAVLTSRSRRRSEPATKAPNEPSDLPSVPDQDVDVAQHAGELGAAAAARAERAGAVRVVEQHDGVLVVRELHDLGERRDVAVHAVDAVDRDEQAACAGPDAGQRLGEGVDVAVAEDGDLAARESVRRR